MKIVEADGFEFRFEDALDANAIQLLNEVPGEVRAALDANEKLVKELKDGKF